MSTVAIRHGRERSADRRQASRQKQTKSIPNPMLLIRPRTSNDDSPSGIRITSPQSRPRAAGAKNGLSSHTGAAASTA